MMDACPAGVSKAAAGARPVCRWLGRAGHLAEALSPWLAYAFTALFICVYGYLAVLRHETFQSSAMDMGYTDQVVWNTLHGRPFRFTTLLNAPVDLPVQQMRRPDLLLAYHVELLLLPISALYLIYSSPVTLVVLQTVVVSLGALPAFWLARDHLQSAFAGLVFAALYLLAPSVEGAILADFHAVSLTASLLLFALYALHKRRYLPAVSLILLSLLAKEDVSSLVFMIGLYVFFVHRARVLGMSFALLGLAWSALCMGVILPYYSGLPHSPFVERLAIFGPNLADSTRNLIANPSLLWRWLFSPGILAYLGGLLACVGYLSLASPKTLAMAAPVVALNTFNSWRWSHSEGEHYSASIVPFLVVSAVYGLGYVAHQIERLKRRSGVLGCQVLVPGLAVVALAVGSYHHYWVGVSPLARQFSIPRVTDHHRLGYDFISVIPSDAPVSAQANLYPHLSQREKAYLYPAVNDAEYVLLDVTGSPFPVTPADVYWQAMALLRSGEFGPLRAEDGYLLLRRGLQGQGAETLPPAFYTFAAASERSIPHALRVRFDDKLELLGYDCTVLNVVNANDLPVVITTFWRALQPLEVDYNFALFFTRADGAIVYTYDGGTATSVWYPTSTWPVGQVVRVETPALAVGRLQDALIAVSPPAVSSEVAGKRLTPITIAAEGQERDVLAQRLVRLLRFQAARR